MLFFIVANYQTGDSFFQKVYKSFLKLYGENDDYRDFKGIGAHWRDLNRQMQAFQACYSRNKGSRWGSGQNDADVQRRAMEEYKEHNNGKTFKHLECWEIVRHHPKWAVVPSTATARRAAEAPRSSKRSKTASTSNPSTPSDAHNVTPTTPSDAHNLDLNDNAEEEPVNLGDEEDFVEMPRPAGRRRKEKGKEAGSSARVDEGENQDVSRLNELLKDHIFASNRACEALEQTNKSNERMAKEFEIRNMEKHIDRLQKRGLHAEAEALDQQLTQLILEKYRLN